MTNDQELKARTIEERAEITASRGGLLSHFLTRWHSHLASVVQGMASEDEYEATDGT